jgi:WhiB family transcriptional regulator, redox-sensing transcriptional regulator
VTAEWRDSALCAETAPDLFFPEKGESARAAKRICARCEVVDACLAYALARGESVGVWGGLTPRERAALKRTEVAA